MFFLHGVAEQAVDANNRAKRLQDLQIEWRSHLQKARVTGLVLGIVDSLFESPVISANEVVAHFKVSHQAAMQALRRLEKMNLLQETTGRQRSRAYLAADIMHAVE